MDRRTSLSVIAAGLAAMSSDASASAPTTGGIKFMVLYGHPPNPAEFEKYYLGTHMPLVAAIKGAKYEAAKCLPRKSTGLCRLSAHVTGHIIQRRRRPRQRTSAVNNR